MAPIIRGTPVVARYRGTTPIIRAYRGTALLWEQPSTGALPLPLPYRRGVVLAGGEYGDNGSNGEETGAAGGLTYTNPGKYGDDYLYPAAGDFAYLKARMPQDPIAKVMLRMERLTTAPGGPLRAEEVTRITAVLDGAKANGVGVILSPWNFGAIWTDNGSGTSVRQPAGGNVFTKAVYSNFWTRVLNQWGDHPALIGLDLMTEPVAVTGGAPMWEQYAQAAVDAIRSLNTRLTIWVSPYGYGIDEIDAHPRPWINDLTGNFGYSGHQYNYNQGGSQTNYANALKSATDQNWTAGAEVDALHAREVASARKFGTWLAGNNGFISEYGIPQTEHSKTTDTAKWQSFLDRLLTEYDALGFWGTIWNAGRVLNKNTLYCVYYPTGGYNKNINAATSTAAIIEKHQSKPAALVYTPNPSGGSG